MYTVHKVLTYTLKLWRKILMLATPLLLLPLITHIGTKEARCGYVALLMGVFWTAEPIPLAVTALIPVVLLPMLGVLSTEETCNFFLQETSVLFIGTLIMAIAIEYSNLHRRIGLKALCLIGTEINRLILGVMLISMFLAIWINNIAVTAMMMPIMDALSTELLGKRKHSRASIEVYRPDELERLTELEENNKQKQVTVVEPTSLNSVAVLNEDSSKGTNEAGGLVETERLRIIMYLSVIYGANIGAIATITSAASNVVFKFVIEEIYEERAPVDYSSWFLFSLPPTVVSVLVSYVAVWAMYLRKGPFLNQKNTSSAKEALLRKYKELGPVNFHEAAVLLLFLLLVFLWMFRDPQFAKGWATYFGSMKPKDATAAMLIVIMLFVIPSKPSNIISSPGLLTWPVVQDKLQWSVILLLGGGFALAEGARVSGLSQWMGVQLAGFSYLSPGLLMFVLAVVTAFISEVISNAGTVTILLPVFAALAEDIKINPLLLMIPSTLTSNFAFILPVGTPANTIVYEHMKMQVSDMILPGFVVKTITMLVTVAFTYALGDAVFGMFTFPAWAVHDNILSVTNVSLTSVS